MCERGYIVYELGRSRSPDAILQHFSRRSFPLPALVRTQGQPRSKSHRCKSEHHGESDQSLSGPKRSFDGLRQR